MIKKIQIVNALNYWWLRICPLVNKYQPMVLRLWAYIEAVAGRAFVLSDHSSLRASRILLRMATAFMLVFFLWAMFFEIDQVVHTQGQVVASSHSQIIQAADAGVLVKRYVQEGDEVRAGQVLAELEKERAFASVTESQGKVMALRMNVMRLQAELAGIPLVYDDSVQQNFPTLFETQINLHKQRTGAINEQLRVLKGNVRLAQEELDMNIPLEQMGDISKADVIRLKRALNEARNQYATTKNKYLQDTSTELNKAQEDLNSQEQILAERRQLLQHTDIVAPAAGIVKSIRVTTIGGVLRQGDEIMQILPTESDLVIDAKVKPSDMAYIRNGDTAQVKLDAYDYSIFGTMPGKVIYISPDTLQEDTKSGSIPYYRIKVAISQNEIRAHSGKADGIEVRPGMTATVDVQTGKRSVLSYLVKPLTKTLSESLGER